MVKTAVTIHGGETVRAAGEDPVTYDVERDIVVFKLVPRGSSWLVSFIGFLA